MSTTQTAHPNLRDIRGEAQAHAHNALTRSWETVKAAVKDALEDQIVLGSAAVAYYAALSLAPMIILLIWASRFLGSDTRDQVISQAESIVGPNASQGLEMVMANAQQQQDLGSIAGWISIGVLVFSATTVFAALQKVLNRIFDVTPSKGRSVMNFITSRAISFLVIVAIGGLLVASLIISSVISAIPGIGQWGWVEQVVTFVLFALLFALILKVMPDATLAWKDALVGGGCTAALFVLGKWAVGLYLGRSAVGSAYGAAGSIVVLLVWVYYVTLIVAFGAELTQAYARRFGTPPTPNEHAEWDASCKYPPELQPG